MFPKVLIEGALASKPLITTTANGAVDTIVIDSYNGFIIEPGDIHSLSVVMTKLFDENLRIKMGKKSREIVDEFCNTDKETKGFVDAINHALYLRNI